MSKDLLLGYYGDDLTGSTDVMESMALGGVPTVLFMRVPDAELQARFAHCRAMGLAGTSRSETPDWMDEHLPPAFAWMKGLGAAICHYKVCSTFDSSPAVGNIGRAIEIGKTAVRAGLRAGGGRRAAAAALHQLRQPVRRLPGPGLPHRPPPGDEQASGDADGRGRPAPSPRQADRPAVPARRRTDPALHGSLPPPWTASSKTVPRSCCSTSTAPKRSAPSASNCGGCAGRAASSWRALRVSNTR